MIIRVGQHESATGRGNCEEPHPWELRASGFISHRMSDLQKHERQNLSGQQAKIGRYQKAVRWVRGSGLLKVDTFRKKPTLPPHCTSDSSGRGRQASLPNLQSGKLGQHKHILRSIR